MHINRLVLASAWQCSSYQSLDVIHWRLAVIMAERNVRNKDLAALTGISERSISRLKVRRQISRIDAETLDALCKALNCQPGDLMVYTDTSKNS
ncbi:MAG: helix-turn-helix transcriptional regulator [Cyanobacteria bacterium P01_A01_bin.137]